MLSAKGFANSRRIPAGSTLFVCIGSTIGKIGLAGEDLATNQQINSIIPNGSVDPEFLFYATSTLSAIVREQAGEQAVPLVNKSQFSEFEIPMPPLVEQRKIAAALADADLLTDGLESLISKKQAIKQGMMQQLLTGRVRLPDCQGEWPTVSLGESGVITGGGVDKTSSSTESAVQLLNYMDVYRAEFIDRGSATQVVTAPSAKIAKCSVRSGDVFFTPTSETPDDIARSAVADADLPGVVYSYHLVRWRPGSGWDPSYLGYAFSTEKFRSQAATLAAGSGTRYVVSMPGFRSFTVPKPSLAEQRAIGAALRDMSDEIDALRVRAAKARALKAGLMQQLLTGRTRLPMEAV
jgi:type I restriction enzyme S subunit